MPPTMEVVVRLTIGEADFDVNRLEGPVKQARELLVQARQALLGYVLRHAEAITAVDRLRPQVSPQARPLLTNGTGTMEKNSETMLGLRFQPRGMRWTRRSAQALLKLHLWIFRHGEKWFEALKAPVRQLTNA